jgi:hypothetical protein
LFPGEELGPARHEYDKLLGTLLKSDDSKVEVMCFNRPSIVVWSQVKHYLSQSTIVQEYIEQVQRRTSHLTIQFPHTPQQATDKSLASVPLRLYLAKSYNDPTWHKMGVASGLVELRDLVCWVRSSRRALLVRVVGEDGGGNDNHRARVFGTELVTEDMCDPTPNEHFYTNRWRSLERETRLKVRVDAGTIFMLLE